MESKNLGDMEKEKVKDAAKQAGKKVAKMILNLIKPALPYIAIGVGIFLAAMLIVSMFANFSEEGMTGDIDPISARTEYIVKTDAEGAAPVITDINKLKKAFSGYPTSSKLLAEAQTFLDMQEKYKVNAIFAAAVAIDETTAGTAGNGSNGNNNWFNYGHAKEIENNVSGHKDSGGSFCAWDTAADGIMGFGYYIGENPAYYFSQGNYTVSGIGEIYCADPAPPEWANNVVKFMNQLYKAVGIVADYTIKGTPGKTGTTTFGDIEIETFTSSKGVTYLMYKQTEGPWAQQTYIGNETFAQSGCPTTAAATVVSGRYGYKYTPLDFKGIASVGLSKVLEGMNLRMERNFVHGSGNCPKCSADQPTDAHKNKIIGYLQEGQPVVFHVIGSGRGGISAFTNNQHWMAILDVNATGDKIYIATGSALLSSGWYNINDALKSLCCYSIIHE